MNVEVRCKRVLGKMKAFRTGQNLSEKLLVDSYCNELLLGGYYSERDELRFFLTDLAVYVPNEFDQTCKRVLFADIVNVELIDWENKSIASRLLVKSSNNDETTINVCGGKGNFRDVFEVLRFFLRVLEDLAKNRE